MKCLTCGIENDDAKFMEDHCKYLGHIGYVETKGVFDDSFKYTTGEDWDYKVEAAKE